MENKPTANKCIQFSELQRKTVLEQRQLSRRGASLFRIGAKEKVNGQRLKVEG